MKSTIAMAILLASSILSSPVLASSLPASGSATGYSEREVGQRAADDEIARLKQEYGVTDGFTEADLKKAAGIAAVKKIRTRLGLGPYFTSDDIKRAEGVRYVNSLLADYPNLAPHFTLGDLVLAMADREILYQSSIHPGLPPHGFSYADYVRVVGQEEAADFAKRHGLPGDFTDADIVDVLGPRDAAIQRSLYKYSKGATHAEIAAKMGEDRARIWSLDGLKPGFSAFDLFVHFFNKKWHEVNSYLHMEMAVKVSPDCTFSEWQCATEEDIAAFAGESELRYLRFQLNADPLLPEGFDEQEYARAMGEKAAREESAEFGVDPGFSEADIRSAAAKSAIAEERQHYKLPQGFTAEQDQAAKNDAQKKAANFCF